MKRDKAADNVSDANSVLKKHLTAAQRKKKKKLTTIIVVTVLVVVVIAVVVVQLRNSVTEKYASTDSNVDTTTVSLGDINTTVSGSGTLVDDDVEDVDIPSTVDVDTVMVEEGDTVAEGDIIATVDTASVLGAMADLQDEIDDIDSQLEDVSDDTVSSKVKAGIDGRVKKIYAETGDDVATVMYEHGALMLISLDGLMAADIETDTAIEVGDTVTVTLSDGSTQNGTVAGVKDSVVTVTVTDNGPDFGDTVTVSDSSGKALGKGTLYIHSAFKVTGYAGTISKVYVSENKKVSRSTKVFYLKDTSYTANYDTLLKERASLEDDLDELIDLYKQGAVYSPISGVVYSVDYDDSEDGTASDSTTSDTAGTAAAASTGTATGTADTSAASGSTDEDHTLIATVCPNATMSVSVDMDESDILSLEKGQAASVTIDSIGDDVFSGTVTDINKTGTSSGGVTVFTVEVTIDKTAQMLAGMSASVDIITDSATNALYIPEDALQQTSTTSYVYTEYDEETQELGGIVEVETGLSNGTSVQITSGLSEGDTVYYEPAEDTTSSFGNMGGFPGSGNFPQDGGGMPGGMPNGG